MSKSSILVAIRVRPLSEKERQLLYKETSEPNHSTGFFSKQLQTRKLKKIVDVTSETTLCLKNHRNNIVNRNSNSSKDISFCFDEVFSENKTQNDVYVDTTRELVDSVLKGYNSTLFAYGATGCGKTHTIRYF